MIESTSVLKLNASLEELFDAFWDPEFAPVTGAYLHHVEALQTLGKTQLMRLLADYRGLRFSTFVVRHSYRPFCITQVYLRPSPFLIWDSEVLKFQGNNSSSLVTLHRVLDLDVSKASQYFDSNSSPEEVLRTLELIDHQWFSQIERYFEFRRDPVCPI